MDDAEKAGLAAKKGPWQEYPKRMCQMRARSWAMRDAFPEAFRGILTVEEAEGIVPQNASHRTLDMDNLDFDQAADDLLPADTIDSIIDEAIDEAVDAVFEEKNPHDLGALVPEPEKDGKALRAELIAQANRLGVDYASNISTRELADRVAEAEANA